MPAPSRARRMELLRQFAGAYTSEQLRPDLDGRKAGGTPGWRKTTGPYRVVSIVAGDLGVRRSKLRNG